MKVFVVLSMLVIVALSQRTDIDYVPIPYSFNYVSSTEDGGSGGHQESGDGDGHVTGSYTVTNLEGHSRTVDYIADENGFRATIRSNEPGTDNQNPADVTIESTASESGPTRYNAPASVPAAPAIRTAGSASSRSGRSGVRYVLVPINE